MNRLLEKAYITMKTENFMWLALANTRPIVRQINFTVPVGLCIGLATATASKTSPILTIVWSPINTVLKPKIFEEKKKNCICSEHTCAFSWSLSRKNTVGQMFVQPWIVECATQARDNLRHIRGLRCRLQTPHSSMLRFVYGCGECQN